MSLEQFHHVFPIIQNVVWPFLKDTDVLSWLSTNKSHRELAQFYSVKRMLLFENYRPTRYKIDGLYALNTNVNEVDIKNTFPPHIWNSFKILHIHYIRELDFQLPHSLVTLHLHTYHCLSLSFSWPPFLKHLYIHSECYELERFPETLLTLSTGERYANQSKEICLPQSLTSLAFREPDYGFSTFNRVLEQGILPLNLQYLCFPVHYDQPLPVFPLSLTHLELGYHKNHRFIDLSILPPRLIHITFPSYFNPNHVGFSKLPSSLTSVTFRNIFNSTIPSNFFPSNISQLYLGSSFNCPLQPNSLPSNLTTFKFPGSFNQPLCTNTFPPTLTDLTFGPDFNQPLQPRVLPTNLLKLRFGYNFNKEIQQDVLPNSLESLFFGCQLYNHRFQPNVLPNSLTCLSLLSGNYNQPFNVNVLPSNLKTLKLGSRYNQNLTRDILPFSLQTIISTPGSKLFTRRRITVDVHPHVKCIYSY